MFPTNTSSLYSRFLCTNCKLHSQAALLNVSFKVFRTVIKGYHKKIDFGATLTNVTELFRLHPSKFHQSKIFDNRIFRREYHAFHKLLQRSSLLPRERIPKLQVLLGNLRAFSISSRNLATPKDDDKKKDKNDDDDDSKMPMLAKALLWMMTSYMVIMMLSLLIPGSNQSEVMRYVSWNEFVHHMLSKGEVEELIIRPELDLVTIVLHDNAIIKDKPAEHKTYHMQIINTQSFEEKIRKAEQDLGIKPENGVPLIYERNQESAWLLLLALVAVAFMILMLSRGRLSKSSVSVDLFPQLRKAKFTIVDPLGGGKGVRFKDVAGLKEAKQEIMEFVDYLKKPHVFKELGAKIPRGALLLGPPGCGKTLLAKAVATEANVPFLVMAGSEFIEMIGGLGAARVRDLFKEARKRSPCIVYIDEVDAIGRKRSGTGKLEGISGEEEQTLNQLLVEMDGMTTKEEVIVLASTNRAEVLDKALLRPGRFDRHILIDFPTLQERKEIFELHLKSLTLDKLPSAYSSRMAQLTPGFSGADIANICNEAALNAARHNEKVVTLNNLEYAVERVIGGTEKRSKVLSDEEKRMVAYHESGHALVGWLLKFTDALLKISIVPRTNLSLGYAQYVPQDQKLYSTEELFERMCMALGGRVAETITFNRCSTGAEDDLKKVTKLAYAQIKTYGMNDVIGLVSFPDEDTKALGRKPYSKKLAYTMDEEVRRLVAKAYKTTEELLINNKNKLELIAEALIEKEVLNYEDIEKLIGPPPFGKKRLIEPIALEMMVNLEDKNKEIRDEKRETSP